MVCMKVIKKNQIIIFIFSLMLIAAGYMNYNQNTTASLETAVLLNSEEVAGIGDAKLVNSNNVADEQETVKKESEEADENNSNNDEDELLQTNNSSVDYFENSKLEREKMYSQMLETYQKILESSTISEEQKAISQNEIAKIQNTKNSIMIAENLIKNKGIDNVIIFVNDYSISVIVDAKQLGEAEIAQIQNIVVRELNAKIEDIHVSKIKE